ncbi:flagellar hook-basal body complex protein [Siculibacillus lacustris]|uniref:Flagellar hook protein FlgE n=1 Tax=Siculibacillus lacustris TaxID=1549641 RepID=A0A4Q9VFK2_9HYPH|nr:flagellar hook-basal body complex protein [Siculibacillus lacustris]TBW33509.1 flagellar hook-basal body complex protein [Siculibacillus lacustris]
MGVFDAMTNAVGGLQAQAYALQNISGNIANSGTTGYKVVDTAFEDLLTSAGASTSMQNSGSTLARSVTTTTAQGTVSSTSVSTNMAISGDGYFQVQSKAGESDGKTVLKDGYAYTRQGDFTMSSEGYLVNSSGYYLSGLPIDASTGNPVGSTASPIKISTGLIGSKATSSIDYVGNLPSDTSVATIDVANLPASSGYPATIAASDNDTFLKESLEGGSVTTYDQQGNEVNVQMRWAKTSANNWNLYYQSDSTATGATAKWTSTGTTFTFSSAGSLTSITDSTPTTTTPAPSNITIPSLTVDGNNLGNVRFNYDTNLTQYNSGTTVSQTNITQNGYASGKFTSAAVSSDGVVTATYSNGKTIDLYKVGIYSFNGDAELLAVSGNAYVATKASGNPLLNTTGVVMGSSLEASNVDITDQFSKMIVTQKAYSANSKVMSTANTMMQDVLDIIR